MVKPETAESIMQTVSLPITVKATELFAHLMIEDHLHSFRKITPWISI